MDKTGMALRFKTIDTSYAGAEDLSYEENVRHGKHASRTSSRKTLDSGKKTISRKEKTREFFPVARTSRDKLGRGGATQTFEVNKYPVQQELIEA